VERVNGSEMVAAGRGLSKVGDGRRWDAPSRIEWEFPEWVEMVAAGDAFKQEMGIPE